MPIGEPNKSSDSPSGAPFTGGIQIHQDDVVIMVAGRTGTGKSSFIKLVSGDSSVRIGHKLESETREIQIVRFADSSGRNVVLVDTPGFGDSRDGVSDVDTLKKITAFLLELYDKNQRLNGIIYFHSIKDVRFKAQSDVNLQTFEGLCGPRNFKNVIVLTTFWDRTREEGPIQETKLKTSFFKALVDGGACFMRHNRTVETARDILNRSFTFQPTNVLIQEEIRLQGKSLQETTAGSVHSAEWERLTVKHEKEIEDAKSQTEESNKVLRDEVDTLRRQLEQLQQERDMLLSRLAEESKQKEQLDGNRAMWETCLEVVKLVSKGLDLWYTKSTTSGK